MQVLPLWNRYIYIALLLCNVQADRRMFNDTQVSQMQELLDYYCPNHTPFTCTADNSSETSTNTCCRGCSCDQSCGLYGNCCYDEDDTYNLMEEGIMKCTFPYTGRPQSVLGNTMYKLIVGPPKGGCVAPGSCNETTELIPWKTLYPVFSKVKKHSYITTDCAACHGVLDGTQWNSLIFLGNFKSVNLDEITDILMASEYGQISVYFNHPGTDLEIMQSICSTTIRDICNPLNKDASHEFFSYLKTILPHLHITFDEMISGCYEGPYSPYLDRNRWYKNLFCAICYNLKSPTDRCIQYDFRGPQTGFSVLMDYEYIAMAKKDGLRKRIMNSKIACKAGTKRDCRPVLCPTMQMRVASGECKFLSTRWTLGRIHLYIALNLTATASMRDAEPIFSNSSESNVLGVLYDKTPWHQCWTIQLAGIRIFLFRNKTMVEMLIVMVCDMDEVSPSTLKTYIQNAMSKVWTMKIDIGLLRFHQDFYKYGAMGMAQERVLMPTSVIDGFVSSMVETPRYWQIFKDYSSLRSTAFMIINKLFYCHQIELKPHEYEYRRVLRLISLDKVLFSNEFIVGKIFDNITVRLCLEDFDMVLVPNGVRTGNITGLLYIVGILYTTLLQ